MAKKFEQYTLDNGTMIEGMGIRSRILEGELCGHCGRRINSKHKYCTSCGVLTSDPIDKIYEKMKNVKKVCPNCNTDLQKIRKNYNITYCPTCGSKI